LFFDAWTPKFCLWKMQMWHILVRHIFLGQDKHCMIIKHEVYYNTAYDSNPETIT
jgi:hypothetical protein